MMMIHFQSLHGAFARENLDRGVFFIVLVLGGLGILLLKIFGAPPILGVVFSGAVLVLYAVMSSLSGRVRIEPETIGDNCYYLGFLFTLVSLAHTLYKVSDASSNVGSSVDIPQIISGFGVALSSTIFGVALRVIMMQFRVDFVAKDREVRAEVNETMMLFRKTMSDALSRMKTFSTESVQLASERDERIRDSSEKLLIDHQKELKENSAMLAIHMKEAFSEAAREAVKEIAAAVVENQKTFHTQMNLALDQIQVSRTRMQELEGEIIEEIKERKIQFTEDLEETEKLLTAHRNELRDSSIMLATHMKEAFSEAARDAVKEITSAVVENQKTLQVQLNLALEHLQESRTRMQEQEAKAYEEIQTRRARMAADLEDAEKLLKEHAKFVSKNRGFQADINKDLEALREKMLGILSQAQEFAEESVKLASERDAEVKKSIEKFLADHRETLKEGANIFSSHMEEAFSSAARKTIQDVSEVITENQRSFQTQVNETLKEVHQVKNRLKEQEAEAHAEIVQRRERMTQNLKETEGLLETHKESINANSKAMGEVTDTIEKQLIPAFVALERRTDVVLQSNKGRWWQVGSGGGE